MLEQNREVDFIAELKYLTHEEGGRSTPATSGYRPGIKFEFEEMQTSGRQIFLNKELVYPGDLVMAEIKIIAIPVFAGKLEEGMCFDFREGATIIGTGKILQILNPVLKIACS